MMKAVFFIGKRATGMCNVILKEVLEVERVREPYSCFTEVDVRIPAKGGFLESKFLFSNKTGSIDSVPDEMRRIFVNPQEAAVVLEENEDLLKKFPFLASSKKGYCCARKYWMGPFRMLRLDRGKKADTVLKTIFPHSDTTILF